MTAHEFAKKWRASTLNESQGSVPHFEELCHLVGHKTPSEMDPNGSFFTYQRRVLQESEKMGFADVWLRGNFGWEYKSKGRDLDVAYKQLLQYRDNLANPPLLIVCDFDNIEVHTNFTGTVSQMYRVTLDHLADSELAVDGTALNGIQVIRACFDDYESLKPGQTTEALTQEAADRFGKLSESLRINWGNSDEQVAKFLTRLIFCMFASDVGLLPKGIISTMIRASRNAPGPTPELSNRLASLFDVMRTGGLYGSDSILHFNGGLFNDAETLNLDGETMGELLRADELDWSDIEPSVFGTLFERILNPDKRSQLGAHYTSRTDIEQIVEPTLMWPLRSEWEEIEAEVDSLLGGKGAGEADNPARISAHALISGFLERLASTSVLDPACGSGNFLYVSLALLKELERRVIAFAAERQIFNVDYTAHPRQLFGIEKDPYAHRIASIVVWIGYLQWKRRNGRRFDDETPILQPLENIHQIDAIVDQSDPDHPAEPDWPDADVIVGNPPFIGSQFLRRELDKDGPYVDPLFAVWDGRVRHDADICCYWFEKARAMVETGRAKRAGLLATQGIRGWANRDTLRRIKESGDIFFAESDRPWKLDGATVRVSMIAFDDGSETRRVLDRQDVEEINTDLTTGLDLTRAKSLKDNLRTCFQGPVIVGPFDVDASTAEYWLQQPNPHRHPNSEVVLPVLNAADLTGRPRGRFIVDFQRMPVEEAALYETPFEHVRAHVKPLRDQNRSAQRRLRWWLHGAAGTALRKALVGRDRKLVTPRVAKYRLFTWVASDTVVTDAVVVFARDDDYFFGVLHSRPHELWARATGTQLRDVESGFRYTPTTTFETFPFPQPSEAQRSAIGEAARVLDEERENWLNPPPDPDTGDIMTGVDLKKRTLTNLYNARPSWLQFAHERSDAAVLDAYGWPSDITDEQILERLLDLNFEREPA
ncbi:MAG: class I SAM-dependent DNA methyltransferase [Chloroflexi bacterium]|nr:class I SAM-dependent DNA methyltransferase [Chloroflexota bacterium]